LREGIKLAPSLAADNHDVRFKLGRIETVVAKEVLSERTLGSGEAEETRLVMLDDKSSEPAT